MQGDRSRVGDPSFEYVRYPKSTFTIMPDALIAIMAERQVGRNGWTVMAALCKMTHANGMLGVLSAKRISEQYGISLPQVARGMRDLRQRGIIAPVVRKNAKGYRRPDKSSFGHVAQYCICKDVWGQVETQLTTDS